MVLLLSDQLLRMTIGKFVAMVNAVDPSFEFFDDNLPEFTEVHQTASTPYIKQHTAHRCARPIESLPKYSPRLAYTLAVASKIVYEDVGVLEHELEKDGFDMSTFRPMAYRNICGFIAKKDDDVLLVFRGTNPLNIQNFVTNVTIRKKEVKSMGNVHKGFWEAMGNPAPDATLNPAIFKIELNGVSLYRTIMSAVDAVLQVGKFAVHHLLHHFSDPVDNSWIGIDADVRSRSMFAQAESHILDICQRNNGQPIRLYVTGHSLGGALATAKMIQSKSPLMDYFAGLYTYGQPNVGDDQFARSFGSQISSMIFRHTYNNDIVSRIPSFAGYGTPPGTLVFIDSSYNVSLFPPALYTNVPVRVRKINFLHLSGLLNTSVIRRLPQETWLRIGFRILCPFFINDHFPTEYCNGLRYGRYQWIAENETQQIEGDSGTFTLQIPADDQGMAASA
ncbi:hypothetical protein EC973_004923 [Apophysomyces ossiformis]|uniref:Fungal lipase-type domain-containing protein n=1 Tax=Apophysomyces ossiformis TaxID=679940 RepID=A0A8H7BS21_9FUNG|nr:hypothetical protein EC973_004923 [Apophysomyces ossiformis]